MSGEVQAVPLTALLAAAIYQARAGLAEPDALERTVELLTVAAGRLSVRLEHQDGGVMVNGSPISGDAPGAAVLSGALADHHTVRLVVPPISIAQWYVVIEAYATPPGVYESVDDLRDALRATVPDLMISGAGAGDEGIDLRDALFELPGLRAVSNNPAPAETPPDPRQAQINALDAQLNPAIATATRARGQRDYTTLAQALLDLAALENSLPDDLRAIVSRERRRVVDPDTLEEMARTMGRSENSRLLARALAATGRDGGSALIVALAGAKAPAERRLYVDALVDCRDCEEAVIAALGHVHVVVVRDAAEVASRKRIARAVPLLAQLLKHRESDIRTSAWHALENIGTREARRALGH